MSTVHSFKGLRLVCSITINENMKRYKGITVLTDITNAMITRLIRLALFLKTQYVSKIDSSQVVVQQTTYTVI